MKSQNDRTTQNNKKVQKYRTIQNGKCKVCNKSIILFESIKTGERWRNTCIHEHLGEDGSIKLNRMNKGLIKFDRPIKK